MDKKYHILFLIFGSILYVYFPVLGSAQRTIEYHEPDFTKEYALHRITHDGLFSESSDKTYPVHYLQFYSPYAKENDIKMMIKSIKNKRGKTKEVYKFNGEGYLESISTTNNKTCSISEYYYNEDKSIIKVVGLSVTDTLNLTTYYFSKEHRIDSIEVARQNHQPVVGPYLIPRTIVFKYDSKNRIIKVDYPPNRVTTIDHDTISLTSINLNDVLNFSLGEISRKDRKELWKIYSEIEALVGQGQRKAYLYSIKSRNLEKTLFFNDTFYFSNVTRIQDNFPKQYLDFYEFSSTGKLQRRFEYVYIPGGVKYFTYGIKYKENKFRDYKLYGLRHSTVYRTKANLKIKRNKLIIKAIHSNDEF